MKLPDLKDKKILVLGLGRDGQSTLKFLTKHFPGKEIGITDQKDGGDYLKKLKDYEVIIKSPGITPFSPEIEQAKKEGKIITSSAAIFFSEFKGEIIGVTGTKGKSTTASLIYEILQKADIKSVLLGNIGTPPLDYLDDLDEETIVVYELSSYQLDDLDKSPHIAVFPNIYPEHLNYHQNFKNYMEAKSHITKYQDNSDYLIYNSEFPELVDIAKESKATKIPFTSESYTDEVKTSLLGNFNKLNIIAATIVGQILLIDDSIINQAVEEFRPLEHRLELAGEKNHILFYNDSLATIPQATIKALDTLGDDVETLIAGGFDRGVDYSVLGPVITKSSIKTLILFPDTGEKIWYAVIGQNSKIKVQKYDVKDMKEAVDLAFRHTTPGKICLLSPASASFNMFKDYADRGEQFKKAILDH